MRYGKHWLSLALVLVGSFLILGYFGREVFQQAPPLPKKVVSTEGRELFTNEDILEGQYVWQSLGGQEVGSIWGHGACVGPDWSADWLHREATWVLERWAESEYGTSYQKLEPELQAALGERLRQRLRANTYNPQTRVLTLDPVVAESFEAVGEYYAGLFGDNPAFDRLRNAYALPPLTLTNPDQQANLNAFFFWTAWACVAQRPGQAVSYTNNWPPDALVGNRPSQALRLWSFVSGGALLAALGGLGFYYAALRRRHRGTGAPDLPERDPLLALRPTPSMIATQKFFWTVVAMLLGQVLLGIITANYSVVGARFHGVPLADWLPYSISRTWHLQLGLFWILAAFMGASLFVAPAVARREPPLQRLGVNVLFFLFLAVAIGSMAGQWWGVHQKAGLQTNFWFGHQGLEYIDMGRMWQFVALGVLTLWLLLLIQAIWPAFAKDRPGRHLLALLLLAVAAITILYAGGLLWHHQTNLAKIEYWRWWVIHLWVEGFFEVFTIAVIAFIFTRMGLLAEPIATAAVLFTMTLFLAGAVVGVFHHLYFTGAPLAAVALGSTLSALQTAPLLLVGLEARLNLTRGRARPWVKAYQWPIYCFVAVAFWNLVGAGVFGFVLNTPVALYYMQGLHATPVHSHAALFGIYGMLALGLLLFCLKGLSARRVWRTGYLAFAFWAINGGLGLMLLLSVLPVGLLQTWASVKYGLWFARSAEFMRTDLLNALRWLRIVGDVIFTAGVCALAWFVAGLKGGWSLSARRELVLQNGAEPAEPGAQGHPVAEKWD